MTIHRGRWYRRGWAALGGLLAAGAAIGLSELVAAFVQPAAAPVVAVGTRLITLTPEPVKEFAIRHFGEHDKTVLLGGIYVVLAAIAVAVGLAAGVRRALGALGFVLFGLIGIVAVLAAPGSGPLDVLPSAVAAAAGAATLLLLTGLTDRSFPRPAGSDADRAASLAGPPSRGEVMLARRRLLLGVAGAAVLAVGAGVGGRVLQGVRFAADRSRALVRLPKPASVAPPVPAGVQLDVPGISRWRTPNGTFYRVDTALSVPQVAADTWQLRIHGRVDHPLTLSFDDLLGRPLVERDITLTCVSNQVGGPYAGNARWLGARLADLLREAGLHRDADQLVSRSADGMTLGTPTSVVMDGRDALLAVGMNGEPLPLEHGFPVRMVVPGLYGYVSACKWIVDLEATTFGAYDAYWTKRGYATHAPIKTESRIDTPKSFGTVKAGTVAVAGVAWAQHRGITRVEVQVDDGPWRPAELAPAAGTDTWRQWLYRWSATPGSHTLRARATDGTGAVQTDKRADPFPNGASGWHTVSVTVT
jgi:DMSO/TMAO reductase YedYZ molybdopterin-dependent catalytic subunit